MLMKSLSYYDTLPIVYVNTSTTLITSDCKKGFVLYFSQCSYILLIDIPAV